MDTFCIKPAQTEDEICGRAYVHWKSWQETYTGLMESSFLARMTLDKCMEVAHRFTDNVLVAKVGEKVVGFAAYGFYRDDALPESGEVYALYVLREYQGKGIGLALMNAAFEKFSRFHTVALWVLKGNEKAIRFYERYGFVFDGAETALFPGSSQVEVRMVCGRETPAFI